MPRNCWRNYRWYWGLWLLVLVVLPLILASCASVSGLFMPSKQEQVNLGLAAAPKFAAQSGGPIPSEVLQRYVSGVGMHIVSVIPPQEAEGFRFTYTALNDQAVNAFALPGGPVFVTRGLLSRLQNEAQLAFVLGHETGHVIAQHVGKQISQQKELQLVMAGAEVALGGKDAGTAQQVGLALGQFAGQVYMLKFSRGEESEADTYGLRYMVAAGYNPQAAIQVMQILQQASGGGGGPDWLSTHPSSPARAQALQILIQRNYAYALRDARYVLNPENYAANVLRQLAAGADVGPRDGKMTLPAFLTADAAGLPNNVANANLP